MPVIRSYDPSKVTVTYAGVRLAGFADGTFITVAPQDDLFQSSVGTDGEVTRVKRNDPRSLVTVTLSQSSTSNDYLSSRAALDVADPNGSGVGVVQVRDLSGTTVFEGSGWIMRKPDIEFSRDVSTRGWVLEVVESSSTIGGNSQNV